MTALGVAPAQCTLKLGEFDVLSALILNEAIHPPGEQPMDELSAFQTAGVSRRGRALARERVDRTTERRVVSCMVFFFPLLSRQAQKVGRVTVQSVKGRMRRVRELKEECQNIGYVRISGGRAERDYASNNICDDPLFIIQGKHSSLARITLSMTN